jgi:hypothetical protein
MIFTILCRLRNKRGQVPEIIEKHSINALKKDISDGEDSSMRTNEIMGKLVTIDGKYGIILSFTDNVFLLYC